MGTKRISLKISDVIKNILPETLEKDLQDNEILCPTCHGLGVVKRKKPFGIREEPNQNGFTKTNWYDNELLTFCPDCYNGVKRLCEFCGKPIIKEGYIEKCDCKEYLKIQNDKKMLRWREIVNKAKCVDLKNVKTCLYCEKNDKYYGADDVDCFIDDWFEEPKENTPSELWVASEENLSLDAYSVCEHACENLHEEATDNIDYGSLQEFLDKWCKEQTGTSTYYPCYKEYVKVEDEWFKE